MRERLVQLLYCHESIVLIVNILKTRKRKRLPALYQYWKNIRRMQRQVWGCGLSLGNTDVGIPIEIDTVIT